MRVRTGPRGSPVRVELSGSCRVYYSRVRYFVVTFRARAQARGFIRISTNGSSRLRRPAFFCHLRTTSAASGCQKPSTPVQRFFSLPSAPPLPATVPTRSFPKIDGGKLPMDGWKLSNDQENGHEPRHRRGLGHGWLGMSVESRRPARRVPGGAGGKLAGGGLAYRPPVGGVVAGVVGGVLVGGVLVGGVLAAAWATYSVIAWPLATTVCGFGFMLSTVLGVTLLVW